MEDVKEIIGGRLSKMVAAQAHNSGSSTSRLGGLLRASSFRSSSSTSAFRRSTRAASLVSKTLVSSLYTDLFDSGSPNYSSIRHLK